MPVTAEINPTLAKEILKNASIKGISVESYLKTVVEGEKDTKLEMMREAVKDELFMTDLAETMSDFQHTDFEK